MRQAPPVASVGLALLLSACGGSPPPPVPPTAGSPQPAPPGPQPAAAVAAKDAAPPAPTASEGEYDAKGRRDPFEPPSAREGAATVASAKLTGIVQSGASVLALVETPDGLGYILKPGDVLGDGRVIEIGRDSVVFSVASRPGSTISRVVLRLAGD